MISVRLAKALGHTHHLRLALARDGNPKRAVAAKAAMRTVRAAEYQAQLDLYRVVWRASSVAERERAVLALKADADARKNPEYTNSVIAETITYLEG